LYDILGCEVKFCPRNNQQSKQIAFVAFEDEAELADFQCQTAREGD